MEMEENTLELIGTTVGNISDVTVNVDESMLNYTSMLSPLEYTR